MRLSWSFRLFFLTGSLKWPSPSYHILRVAKEFFNQSLFYSVILIDFVSTWSNNIFFCDIVESSYLKIFMTSFANITLFLIFSSSHNLFFPLLSFYWIPTIFYDPSTNCKIWHVTISSAVKQDYRVLVVLVRLEFSLTCIALSWDIEVMGLVLRKPSQPIQ